MGALPVVQQVLRDGWNTLTFTGASGSSPEFLAEKIGFRLQGMWRFDAITQSFSDVYRPDAPIPSLNTLTTLNGRDALFVLVEGGPITVTLTAILPVPGNVRVVSVASGWTMLAYTGTGTIGVESLLGTLTGTIDSAWRFDTNEQRWLGYFPGFAFLTDFDTVSALDVLFIRTSGSGGTVVITETDLPPLA